MSQVSNPTIPLKDQVRERWIVGEDWIVALSALMVPVATAAIALGW